MRRVVVTGLGMVTPLGADVETVWANILAGKSGAGKITHFDASGYKCHIACEVKPADHEYGFDPNKRVDHKVQRQVDPFIIFGIDAAGQALIHLVARDAADRAAGPTGAIDHVALRCTGFAATCATLAAQGIAHTVNDGMFGLRQINLFDPDAVKIELNFPGD